MGASADGMIPIIHNTARIGKDRHVVSATIALGDHAVHGRRDPLAGPLGLLLREVRLQCILMRLRPTFLTLRPFKDSIPAPHNAVGADGGKLLCVGGRNWDSVLSVMCRTHDGSPFLFVAPG